MTFSHQQSLPSPLTKKTLRGKCDEHNDVRMPPSASLPRGWTHWGNYDILYNCQPLINTQICHKFTIFQQDSRNPSYKRHTC